jgi:hypothetical protein
MSKNGSVTTETHRAVKRKVANLKAELAMAEELLVEAHKYVSTWVDVLDYYDPDYDRAAVLKEAIGLFLVRLEQRA